MKLAATPEAGRPQCEFPTLNHGGIPRDRPEDVRFSDIVMIEPIPGAGFKSIGVERPAAIGNRDAKLVLPIALATQGTESKILAVRQTEQRAGGSQQRRSLIKFAVKAAKDPVQARDSNSNANARVGRILHNF